MKLVKTSAIAVAMSALLAAPVLAQGVSSETQIRGGTQGKMQGGMSGSGDEELAAQSDAPGAKAGVKSKSSTKGTVGAAKSTGGVAVDPATGGKRY